MWDPRCSTCSSSSFGACPAPLRPSPRGPSPDSVPTLLTPHPKQEERASPSSEQMASLSVLSVRQHTASRALAALRRGTTNQ